MTTAVIVGGGVSGLAACHYLVKSAKYSKVKEKTDQIYRYVFNIILLLCNSLIVKMVLVQQFFYEIYVHNTQKSASINR